MSEAKKRIPINHRGERGASASAQDTPAPARAEDAGPDDRVASQDATDAPARSGVTSAEPTIAQETIAHEASPEPGASSADPDVIEDRFGFPGALAADDPAFADVGAGDLVQVLAAERDEYLDGLRRLKAEFDNFRKRSQRDVLEAGTRARLAVLLELLPVLDNLERALSAAEHHEEGKVLEGVRLTHSLFADLLKKEGVVEVDPLGTAFDPTQHEALMTQPSNQPEGTVTAVFQRGYLFGERLLRPAKVVVSAGPDGGSAGSIDGPAGPGED